MDKRIRRKLMPVVACVAGVLGVAGAQNAEHHVDFVERPGAVIVEVNGGPLATYVYREPQILRPHFKDLYAPGGLPVTRPCPPREGIDPTDHADMHPGLWLAFGDISGADFWRNKAHVEHVRFVKQPHSDKGCGGFTVLNRYRDGNRIVCQEMCEYTFLVRPGGYLILWSSTFESDDSTFYFGDQEEMGLGVRLATPIMVKSRTGGRILDSEGHRNEKGIWGKPAQWCDYSGWLAGVFAGVTIMPDPENSRPCRWHTRDYGFMAANPFGRAVFNAGPPSKLTVRPGELFHLGFGVLLHAGVSEDSVDLAAAYQDYLDLSKSMSASSPEEN
ncbi:MAG: PmoA family protein [Phycisphaerales bacterium]|nr:MAG: PmoA family protein [Phycisphaerales bacterium]